MQSRAATWIGAACISALSTDCAVPMRRDQSFVEAELARRTGHAPRPAVATDEPRIPDGARLEDGLSEDEAVAVALWNNAAFREVLTELGFSRADLIAAGLLSNPVFSVLFPVGPKQLEFAAKFPVEALWLRPRRVAVAQLDVERTAQRLVQQGLDLVRDVRLAWTQAVFATLRARLADENVELSRRIEALAEARLRAGDVSELESLSARMGTLLADEEARRLAGERAVAEARLRAMLGVTPESAPIVLGTLDEELPPAPDVTRLVDTALAARPDARAAELAIEAARERAGLARWEVLALSGVVDANGKGERGFEIGPGLEVGIPIFNRNQAGRARAAAEIERATRQYATVRDRIGLEVSEASARLRAATEQLALWRGRALPEMEAAVGSAENAYAAGDVSLFLLLQTSAQRLAIRIRHLEALAEVARARAELERGVGSRLEEGKGGR